MSVEEHKAQTSQHAPQLGWISPEPKQGWNLGSCDMLLYEPIRTRVEVARTAERLAGVTDGLVKSRA